MVSRDEVELAAHLVATRICRTEKELKPGWWALLDTGIWLDADGTIDAIEGAKLQSLLDAAKVNVLAFQACKALAAEQVVNGKPVPVILRQFVAKVLLGDITAPNGQGNRPNTDSRVYRKIMQYILIISLKEKFKISLCEGEKIGRGCKNSPKSEIYATEIVANAFSRLGKNTTNQQMKSLLYDRDKIYIRMMGDWALERPF